MKKTNPFSKALGFIEAKLHQVAGIRKPQHKFLSTLFEVMWTVPHRINFLNMGRFSSLSEQSFRLHFLKPFDFLELFTSMLLGKEKKRDCWYSTLRLSVRVANAPTVCRGTGTVNCSVQRKDWRLVAFVAFPFQL